MNWIVATFYKFVSLPDYESLQPILLEYSQAQNLKGTILLASEGINATLAGNRQEIDNILIFLKKDTRFADLTHRESSCENLPFQRLKVRLKKEIVTFGQESVNPDQQVGVYVEPEAWNELLRDPTVLVIDTRNDYEISIGSFWGAINPRTHAFNQFPDYVQKNLDPQKHQKIAMFCTGGIRCEKASSYLLAQGFPEIYHLKGGILQYLKEIAPEDSLWQGECFVFDERVALEHGLEVGSAQMCSQCGYPLPSDSISCPDCGEETGGTT